MKDKIDWVFVVLCDNHPIAVAHTREDVENMISEYCTGVMIKYEVYNSKYPSINDLEGVYTYKDGTDGSLIEFKIYGVEYKREKQ